MTPKQKPGKSKQNYATPQDFLRATCCRLGIDGFVFDIAADASNTVAPAYWTEADDALSKDWSTLPTTGWSWLNPPYAHIEPWVKKAAEADRDIAVLIPASVGANWWKSYVHKKAETLFLNGRLAFMRDKPKWLYPKDCALVLYHQGGFFASYDIWTWK